jgi:hypothetical protein
MALTSNYQFNNLGRIGYDSTDNSQKNMQNTQYISYTTSHMFNDSLKNNQLDFIYSQPTLNVSATAFGVGLNGSLIDADSKLLINSTQERAFEKLQLFQRPFVTIPYLGRGSCDPALELQLLQGETVSDKKSTSTIMDKTFMDYHIQPNNEKMQERMSNSSNYVEESALNGWVRGGIPTKNTNDSIKKNA